MANVLVVDDEAKVRAYLRRVLTKLGHEVSEAPDGAEALRLLDASAFDLVITDAYMAEMDGMELLVRIQQRGLRVPVVMMSGGGLHEAGRRAHDGSEQRCGRHAGEAVHPRAAAPHDRADAQRRRPRSSDPLRDASGRSVCSTVASPARTTASTTSRAGL